MTSAPDLVDVARRVHRRLVVTDAVFDAHRVAEAVADEAPLLSPTAAGEVARRVLADATGLGPIDELLADPSVTEVMVNGPDRVWVERHGVIERVGMRIDAAAIHHAIEKVVGPLGLRVDRSSPLVDARLPDGSRVHAVVPPLAIDGPCLTIRRFRAQPVALDEFCAADVAAFLADAVSRRSNIVVAGGTSAGKTTLVNALASHIGHDERVVTIEDTAELRLPQPNVVRLEARPANAEGVGAVSVRMLVRTALRMRPDRIVVGESRGPEALDVIQAMNTGHEGSLSTCHANSPADALLRLETMILLDPIGLSLAAVRHQLASAIDLVVQVARGAAGFRRVVEVAAVEEVGDGPLTCRRVVV
jgi:pilus assembly protein CpaF